MRRLNLRSAAEQVADHLKEGILHGEFRDLMPGKETLAAQLGVNHKTVTEAMGLLEREESDRAAGARADDAGSRTDGSTLRSAGRIVPLRTGRPAGP